MYKSPFFFVLRKFTKDRAHYIMFNNDPDSGLRKDRYSSGSLGKPIGPSVFWEWEDE